MRARVAVLASGEGSNLQALLDACEQRDFDAQIAVVVSHRVGSGALRRAEWAGVPAIALPFADFRDPAARHEYELRLLDVVRPYEPDLVVLAGWMFILSGDFLDRCPCPVLNVHPALLPLAGCDTTSDPLLGSHIPVLRGAHAVRDAITRRLPYTGVSVHYVTTEVDAGPVVRREIVPISPEDDEASLYRRIKPVEHRLLPQAVGAALQQIQMGGVYA